MAKKQLGTYSCTTDAQGRLDELVVDDWLHIERMSKRNWHLRIGELDSNIHITRFGKVTLSQSLDSLAEQQAGRIAFLESSLREVLGICSDTDEYGATHATSVEIPNLISGLHLGSPSPPEKPKYAAAL